jgi:hypothetical protein
MMESNDRFAVSAKRPIPCRSKTMTSLRRNSPSSATAKPPTRRTLIAATSTMVEKWDAAQVHVQSLIHASNDLACARAIFATDKDAPTARSLHVTPRHPGARGKGKLSSAKIVRRPRMSVRSTNGGRYLRLSGRLDRARPGPLVASVRDHRTTLHAARGRRVRPWRHPLCINA